VTRIPGQKTGGHLHARTAGASAKPAQLLLGHCDTVWPEGMLKEMPLLIDENVVRGPGVYDMKGGLVQMIFALRVLRELGLTPSVPPSIFVNSDEEIGSPESTPHIRRLAQKADRVLVLEPALGTGGKIKIARKGVGRFSITITGRAAHAGLDPEKGVSAILELSYVIQKLHDMNDPERGISVNVGLIEGGTRTNVIAPRSSAQVDVRAPTLPDARRIEERILNLQPQTLGTTLEVVGAVDRPPLEPTPANQRLWELAQESARRLGLTLEGGMAGGGSDGNTTSQYTATLDGLGAVGDGAHATHEFIFIDKMVERSALLSLLLLSPTLG
jgi:glutamate carboxypeptidase